MLNTSVRIGQVYDWTDPKNPQTGTYDRVLHERSGINVTDFNHRVNGKWVNGSPWWLAKTETIYEPSAAVTVFRAGRKAYHGKFVTEQAGSNLPPWWWSNTHDWKQDQYNQLSADLAGAYNGLKPTRPDFSLGRALYELKDVPDMLKHANEHLVKRVRGKATKPPSRTEEWYLAIQFGWLPLLSDIRSFVNTQMGMQKRLAQLIKDEGKPVRRSNKKANHPMRNPYNEPNSSPGDQWTYIDNHAYNTNMRPGLVTQCYGGGAAQTEFKGETNVHTWMEGQFRYLLPPGPKNVLWKAKMIGLINGLKVTPSEVYKAMPWTWLADFFLNLGSFLEAQENGVADLLICDYCYVMCTYEWKATTTSSQFVYTDKDATVGTMVTSSITTTYTNKSRWPASTFGFGVKQSDLTPFQVSVLGALGKSRL